MRISSIFVSTGAIDRFANGALLVTGPKATAGIFATYLPEHMTLWRGFLDEVSDHGCLHLKSYLMEQTEGFWVGLF